MALDEQQVGCPIHIQVADAHRFGPKVFHIQAHHRATSRCRIVPL